MQLVWVAVQVYEQIKQAVLPWLICVVSLLIYAPASAYLFAFSTYICTAPAYIYLWCLWASSAYLCRVLTYLCAVLAYAWL